MFDPENRRYLNPFINCTNCGPQIQLLDQSGDKICERENAITETVLKIKEGKIVALKGLGCFQLIVSAGDDDAVQRLRERKHRDEKPFAVMFPSIEIIKLFCDFSEAEELVLNSPYFIVNAGSFLDAIQVDYINIFLKYLLCICVITSTTSLCPDEYVDGVKPT